jgi:hypothetical protein
MRCLTSKLYYFFLFSFQEHHIYPELQGPQRTHETGEYGTQCLPFYPQFCRGSSQNEGFKTVGTQEVLNILSKLIPNLKTILIRQLQQLFSIVE